MLTLSYSKGSSALAAHILLEEAGADYEAVEISIPKWDHLTPEFVAKNPKSRVPVLETPEGVLTENPAILEYIATIHPKAGFLPEGVFAQAQARSLSAYLCATAHVAFAHKQRGRRWAVEEISLLDMQKMVPQNLVECANLVESQTPLAPWVWGGRFSYSDPYLFLLERWLTAAEVSLDQFPKLAAHRDAMLWRPAVQKVLAIHGIG